MGFAVNATTMGMAVAGLGVAYFSRSIDRRRGILVALTVLALPTALLAVAPNLAALRRCASGMAHGAGLRSPLSIWGEHLKNPLLRPSFAIGFCILFAFIGTFTYVNFVLAREPLALSAMALGFVYLVFAPSLVTTLLAGRTVQA